MGFVAPLVLVGLGALAIPVLIHLIQRERKRVVEFPSLMFLRKIPYESVQRRRIRDWLLLALRLAAIALIVTAFARPFLRGSSLAAAPGGARDIVVLLDRSYSMGYADSWSRAQRAAAQAIDSATPADRISVVLFADTAEIVLRSTPDRSRAVAQINAATPGPGSTRYGPALKLAGSLLAESLLPRKEVILVSDFQRGGWLPDDTLRLPGGTTITTAIVEGAQGASLALTPVALLRSREAGQPERVTVTAGVLNRTATAAADVPINLEIDGRVVQDLKITIGPSASASISFAPVTITSPNTRAIVRLGTAGGTAVDALARDNVFNFVLTPAAPVPVMAVSQGPADATLYLTRALAIGEAPRFDATLQSPDALAGDAMNRARVILLNDVPIGDAVAKLPPSVARFRMGSDANRSSHSCTTRGALRQTRPMSLNGNAAPMRTPASLSEHSCSSGIASTLTRRGHRLSRRLDSTPRSVQPAITVASKYDCSVATHSSSVVGREKPLTEKEASGGIGKSSRSRKGPRGAATSAYAASRMGR